MSFRRELDIALGGLFFFGSALIVAAILLSWIL